MNGSAQNAMHARAPETGDAPARDGEISLAAKVAFLRDPAHYPEPTRSVIPIETHMSWVFLTDRYAYKLKKPVAYDSLDFRSLAARKHFCGEELRLNRRLARNVYVGRVPFALAPDNALRLEGFGEPVDWLVKMRRLPAEHMLDALIVRGALKSDQLCAVALRLAEFYRAARPVATDPAEYRGRFGRDIRTNRDELADPRYELPDARIAAIVGMLLRFLEARGDLLENRTKEQRIVEGHGDLRPEHICLEPEPQIIDCLEFHRPFRLLDPVDELCFLALECERLGAAFAHEVIFGTYVEVTRDRPPVALYAFYKSYRALLRAKIAIWHLREPDVREPEKWPELARRYLDLAEAYAERLRATAGGSGSSSSSTSEPPS